jgi:hypothetical protein
VLQLVCFHLFKLFFLYGNIIFYLHLFDLCPLSQESNQGIRKGLCVSLSLSLSLFCGFSYVFASFYLAMQIHCVLKSIIPINNLMSLNIHMSLNKHLGNSHSKTGCPCSFTGKLFQGEAVIQALNLVFILNSRAYFLVLFMDPICIRTYYLHSANVKIMFQRVT